MELTLKKIGWLDDWYIIERAEHDGRKWTEQTEPGCFSLRCSSRFSDADVEGSAEEMRDIAAAIEARSRYSAKRCAVRIEGQAAQFSSPRNSSVPGVVSLEEADGLARKIRELLGTGGTPDP